MGWFYFVAMLLCIVFRNDVKNGAINGLSLWYSNVLPIVLPFLLLSSYLLQNINIKNKKLLYILPIILGNFCGIPIGASVVNKLYENNCIRKKEAELLLSVSCNLSPMFICTYVHSLLNDKIKLPMFILIIYLPQLAFTIVILIHLYKTSETAAYIQNMKIKENTSNTLLDCIRQITIIGIYIMIFSVIFEILNNHFCINIIQVASSYLEATTGIHNLYNIATLNIKIRTALITSLTVYGGVSSSFQISQIIKTSNTSNEKQTTNNTINKNTGLSLKYYILIKVICSVLSGLIIYYCI